VENPIIDIIKTRRSVRSFLPKKIPDDYLNLILEAAQWAPSACNQQLWHFIIIKDDEIKKRLAREAGASKLILRSPVAIAVCYHSGNIKEGLQSASAAIENMLLMATSLGVGSLYLNSFGKETKVMKILKIPNELFVVAFVLLGYPEHGFPSPKRRPLKEIVHENYYSECGKEIFSHDVTKWTLDMVRDFQERYSRKTDPGIKMDIVNEMEIKLIQNIFSRAKYDNILDIFSYDGSLVDYYPDTKIYSLNLGTETSLYTSYSVKREIEHILYNELIPLKDKSISNAICVFKLERIPPEAHNKLFSEIKRVLKDDGSFIIVFRSKNSLYGLIHKLIKIKFGDDIRKSGIYSFFGPYNPLKTAKVVSSLNEAGLSFVNVEKFYIIPPLIDDLYQLLIHYYTSGGGAFYHREKRKSITGNLIQKIIGLQKIKNTIAGSIVVITVKK
jgi:nitroreductase/SAM-dependent methyltransferase